MTLTPIEAGAEHGDMAKRTTTTTTTLGGRERQLTGMLSVRLSDEDVARLSALSERMPVFTPTTIARIAMRLGLAALERDPSLALSQPIERRGGARKRKR